MDNIHIESTCDLIALALFGDYQSIKCEHIYVAHSSDRCYLKVRYRVIFSNYDRRCFALKFNLDTLSYQRLGSLEVVEG